jgi:hypothetical protein
MASVLAGGLLVGAVLAVRMGSSSTTEVLGITASGQPPHVQAGYQPGPSGSGPPASGSTAVRNPTAGPQPAATASPQATDRWRVAGTDGQGVVLRASPRDNDWTPRGFMDGDWVTVLERRAPDWARVRGDNDQEGWVPARYLSR